MLTTYVDVRLVRWAEWRLRRDDAGIGYPQQAVFARGIPQPPNPDAWLPAMHAEAAEIDQCVCALIVVRREAIMHMYTRTSSIRQKADACFCSERTFYNRLHSAKVDILGYLNDLAADIPLPVRGIVEKFA